MELKKIFNNIMKKLRSYNEIKRKFQRFFVLNLTKKKSASRCKKN